MATKKQLFTPSNPLLRRTAGEEPSDTVMPDATPDQANMQSTVFLPPAQHDWLEDRHREIRRRGGSAKVKKAAIIRALITVAMDHQLDLQGVRSEQELVERIRAGLGRDSD